MLARRRLGVRPRLHRRRLADRLLPDPVRQGQPAFLKAAVAYYYGLGAKVARVMTDNGSCYRSKDFRDACHDLGLKHIRTRPYTPKTNGKAERFIQTALREWAYAQAYPSSDRRAEELPGLAAPIQLASTARQPKIPGTHQQTRASRGQPVERRQGRDGTAKAGGLGILAQAFRFCCVLTLRCVLRSSSAWSG